MDVCCQPEMESDSARKERVGKGEGERDGN